LYCGEKKNRKKEYFFPEGCWAFGFYCFVLESGSHYVVQAGLELMILLPQPPICWDYRRVSLYPTQVRLWAQNQAMEYTTTQTGIFQIFHQSLPDQLTNYRIKSTSTKENHTTFQDQVYVVLLQTGRWRISSYYAAMSADLFKGYH
jgi:hypothetical protein